MKEKNTKVNLILSIISFSLTSFLLIMITLAWYATNKVAYVTAGIGHTKGDDYDLTLQIGTYDNGWDWEDTNDLSITSLQPGDTYFFRFVIEYEAKVKFETSFSEIHSGLVENGIVAVNEPQKTYVRINGTGQNWLEATGNQVNIIEVVNNVEQSPKQLYSISNDVVSLNTVDYNVADTFKLYDYGLGTGIFGNDATIDMTNDTKESGGAITSAILTSNPNMRYDLSDPNLPSSGTVYGYFALEFNDELSTKTYVHIDGAIYSDSNLYQCQTLTIGAIALRDITEA